MSSTFRYDERLDGKLEDFRSVIRTLQFEPTISSGGTFNPEIRLNVTLLSVSDVSSESDASCAYDALSYTWGRLGATEVIKIDGRDFFITPTLKEALCQILSNGQKKPIWIDAICINQTDDIEKAHQIGMMGMIYRKASNVLIWLGPEADCSSFALEQLELLGARCAVVLEEVGFDFLRMRTQIETEREVRERDTLYDEIWLAFKQLEIDAEFVKRVWLPRITAILERAWWSRAWIQQEVALARSPLLVCGSTEVFWDNFSQGLSMLMFIYDAKATGKLYQRKIGPSEEHKRFEDVYSQHARPLIAFRDRFQASTGGIPFPQVIRDLTILHHAECKDPWDRVFSVLGVVGHLNGGKMVPKLPTTAELAFGSTTKAVIASLWENPRDCLRILAHSLPDKRIKSLPSWCPDWTTHLGKAVPGAFQPFEVYCADWQRSPASLGFEFRDCFPESVVRGPNLPGIAFDTIAELGVSFDEINSVYEGANILPDDIRADDGEEVWATCDWLEHCVSFFESHQFEGTKQLYGSDLDALFAAAAKTILMDHTIMQYSSPNAFYVPDAKSPLHGRAGEVEIQMLKTILGRTPAPSGLLAGEDIPDFALNAVFGEPYIRGAYRVAHGFRPMVSKKGYYGLVPHTAKLGDSLIILLGLSAPVVLRDDGDHWIWMGTCFIQGVMDGEIVQASSPPYPRFLIN
jgi:hypothetical protein